MIHLADPLIDFDALWKILAASVAGGAGVVIAFGLMLFGRSRYEAAGEDQGVVRAGALLLVAAGAAFCVGALVIGFVAMTHKS